MPLNINPFELNVKLLKVDTPEENIFPVTSPIKSPVTLPVRLPVTFPVTPPVNAPLNVVAVTIPDTTTPAAFVSKFGAFISPTKLVAVTIPDANICPPSELIPTPVLKLVGSPPT